MKKIIVVLIAAGIVNNIHAQEREFYFQPEPKIEEFYTMKEYYKNIVEIANDLNNIENEINDGIELTGILIKKVKNDSDITENIIKTITYYERRLYYYKNGISKINNSKSITLEYNVYTLKDITKEIYNDEEFGQLEHKGLRRQCNLNDVRLATRGSAQRICWVIQGMKQDYRENIGNLSKKIDEIGRFLAVMKAEMAKDEEILGNLNLDGIDIDYYMRNLYNMRKNIERKIEKIEYLIIRQRIIFNNN